MIYDQPENESFSSKNESVQYNASPAGVIRGTSQEKLCQELGLESLRSRRWLRHMCYFYKLIKTQKLLYLFNLIPPKLNSFRYPNTYWVMRCRNDYYKNSFIPYVVREWNRLSIKIRIQPLTKNLGNRFCLLLNQPSLHCFLFITLLVSNY